MRLNCLATLSLLALAAGTARAGSVTIQSDANTLAAGLGSGTPSAAVIQLLEAGNDAGLVYSPVLVGGFGSFAGVPPGAPAATAVVNIAPGDGQSGFYRVTFTLPSGFVGPSLLGAGNVDDSGKVFLNGTAISPSLGSAGALGTANNQTFSTTDASLFQVGQNVLLVADANFGSGPSAAAFYATVTFNVTTAVPEPAGLTLAGACFCGLMLRAWRRRVTS